MLALRLAVAAARATASHARISSGRMLLPALSRRALILALGAATAPPPRPSHAATDGLSQLRAAQQTLVRVDGLLPERGSWPEAQRLLNTLDDGVLTKALEAAVDPKSLKDTAMDQAAFIVYYEEVRYNDKRLEPQTPVRQGSNPGLTSRPQAAPTFSHTRVRLALGRARAPTRTARRRSSCARSPTSARS